MANLQAHKQTSRQEITHTFAETALLQHQRRLKAWFLMWLGSRVQTCLAVNIGIRVDEIAATILQ